MGLPSQNMNMAEERHNKFIQALIDNEQGKLDMGPSTDPFLSRFPIQWIPAPESSTCPDCASPMERSYTIMQGPWSGAIRCTKCDYRNSVMTYLASQCFEVQPMHPGAMPIYDHDPPTEDPESK